MQYQSDTEWLQEQNRRKEYLKKACDSKDLNVTRQFNEKIYLDNFIVDERHKLLYCYIPKVKTNDIVYDYNRVSKNGRT